MAKRQSKAERQLQELLSHWFERGYCLHCEHLVDDHAWTRWPRQLPIRCYHALCKCLLYAPRSKNPPGGGLRLKRDGIRESVGSGGPVQSTRDGHVDPEGRGGAEDAGSGRSRHNNNTRTNGRSE